MTIKGLAKRVYKKIHDPDAPANSMKRYLQVFQKYSFTGTACIDEVQYEAVITRWYHTIEKGLAYLNYRAGFGVRNIESLMSALENYVADGYDIEAPFYKSALCVLHEYVSKNKAHGYEDENLEKRIAALPGTPNEMGGVFQFVPLSDDELKQTNYEDFTKSRHSIRHFSEERVDPDRVKKAIALAQYTPSACNRQGWKSRMISDKDTIRKVLENQNGNAGFGHEIDTLVLITADLRYFNRERELFQVYIDGGMYAQSVLNALHYNRLGTVPLSASLLKMQEDNIRKLLSMKDSEMFILFIGVGNYPEVCQTTRSDRKTVEVEIF